jgi:hypothetical protein
MSVLRKKRAWQMTELEVYENIFRVAKESLGRRCSIATRVHDSVFVLSDPSHIRQGSGVKDLQIKTRDGWLSVPSSTIDQWAATLDLVGPSNHYFEVEQAIKDHYPVPEEVLTDYKMMIGVDKKSVRAAKVEQITRIVDEYGRQLPITVLDKPTVGDVVEYRLSGQNTKKLTVRATLSYRPYDQVWIVAVAENDARFYIQRIHKADGSRVWSAYVRG